MEKKTRKKRLSLYEQMYRELDAKTIGAESKKIVCENNERRYNYADEIACSWKGDDYYITVTTHTRDELSFAEKVAKTFNRQYFIKDSQSMYNPYFTIYISCPVPEE